MKFEGIGVFMANGEERYIKPHKRGDPNIPVRSKRYVVKGPTNEQACRAVIELYAMAAFVSVEDVLSKKMTGGLTKVRAETMYALRSCEKANGSVRYTFEQIGEFMNRHHSTVIHAVRHVERRIAAGEKLIIPIVEDVEGLGVGSSMARLRRQDPKMDKTKFHNIVHSHVGDLFISKPGLEKWDAFQFLKEQGQKLLERLKENELNCTVTLTCTPYDVSETSYDDSEQVVIDVQSNTALYRYRVVRDFKGQVDFLGEAVTLTLNAPGLTV